LPSLGPEQDGTLSDIFISYKREEQPQAKALAEALEGQGWSVWWDPKLRAGEHFDDVIEKALHETKCVIVLWSKRSVESRYVRDEATYALNRRKLIPAAIEDVAPPFRFEGLQTAQLRGWDGSVTFPGFLKLVDDIKSVIGPPPDVVAKEERKREAKTKSKSGEETKRGAGKATEKRPVGVSRNVALVLAALPVAFWGVWGPILWRLARTGELNMFVFLFITLSHALLPLVGGVLVVVKSRAATYVFGAAALCGLLVLFVRPDLLLLLLITITLAACACIFSARYFRSRDQDIAFD